MDLVGFDVESHLIQPGLLAPPLVCGTFAFAAAVGPAALHDKAATLDTIRGLLVGDLHIVGHNIAYDFAVCAAEAPDLVPLIFAAYEAGRIHDTGIRESLIDIERGMLGVDPKTGRRVEDDEAGYKYSLAVLVERHLGLDISADKSAPDAWRLKYATLENVPLAEWPEAAREYPKRDALYPLQIFESQAKIAAELPNGGNLHDEARSVYNTWVLHLISCWGLRTNGAKVAALEAAALAKQATAMVEFRAAGIVREDGTEDKKRVQALVSAAYDGNPPYTNPSATYPSGQIATDRDTKIESADPLLVAHGNSGKNNKYLTTYIPKIRGGADRPINPAFYGMAATTRVTSDYQQLPKKGGIRECHEARPGYVYCSVDYGGLELRTMSQRAIWETGYSKMADALNSGFDPHCIVAGQMLGISYDEAVKRNKAKDPQTVAVRGLAKIFNFGKGGGMGARTMVYHARAKEGVRFCQVLKKIPTCGAEGYQEIRVRGQVKRVCSVCVSVSEVINAAWLGAWPEQAELFERAGALVAHGEVDSEIPVVRVRRGGCGYSQWLNTPFQGLGAVITTLGMRRIAREMYVESSSPLWGSRMVLNVHDELIAELREDRFREAAERQASLMRQAGIEVLPDLGRAIEAEPAVSRIMSKDAATVRDEAGILQIWEPAPEKAA